MVFHAGTTLKDDLVVTNGGRVIAVTSYGDNFKEAIAKSYPNIKKITFDKMYYRKDIGFDLKRLKRKIPMVNRDFFYFLF